MSKDVGAGLWRDLAVALDAKAVAWRQDGKPKPRPDGTFAARFVAYVEAGTVRERLDAVCPGDWTLALELLPPLVADHNGEVNETPVGFKATLTVCGVARQDVGVGRDYKQASTDAFKRAAVRFGIGHELYDMEPCWVKVDGEGKYAKPLEDPATVYAQRHAVKPAAAAPVPGTYEAPYPLARAPELAPTAAPARPAPPTTGTPTCPKCGGFMWDNRVGKRNPKAPDFKCKDKQCDGVVWPPKPQPAGVVADDGEGAWNHEPPDNLPF